ncbi:hypothetical protein M9Y10_009409 [Tritrichomonas musculus]|uniref:Uncharacterized protein n=1 Tax=Tritrichomonas musculus TaxID=1915356 RepID=A0ABR2IPS8_9EUKA
MSNPQPIIDIVSQSGVAPFSYEIANSNSIPNPISPLGAKTDPTKKFKYRFSEDLPANQLYRFQLAPEKNKKTPIQVIKQKIVEFDDIDGITISTENSLISTPSSLDSNFSSSAKKLVKKSIQELENTHQNTRMPPSFHLEPEERLIKKRMPFLVLHGNPLQKYVIDYEERVITQQLQTDDKPQETQYDIDSNNKGYFENVPRVSYNDYVQLQNQIIDLQQQQRTKHFLPDHVPPSKRRKAQRLSFSRPMTQAIPPKAGIASGNNSIIPKRNASTALSKSSPSPFKRPLDFPELTFNSKGGGRRSAEKQRFSKSVKQEREYSYISNANFNDDDEEIKDRIISHNELVKSFTKMIENPIPSTIQPYKSSKTARSTMANTPFNSSRTQQQNY